MPIFKELGENGEVKSTRDEPLTFMNFDQYVKENGIEKAQGYLEAAQDFYKQLQELLYHEYSDGSRYPRGLPFMTKEGCKLLKQKEMLLECAQELKIPGFDTKQGPQ
jgi:hypothetical protein